MRYRLMATYFGVPYHAGLGPDGNEATLLSVAAQIEQARPWAERRPEL